MQYPVSSGVACNLPHNILKMQRQRMGAMQKRRALDIGLPTDYDGQNCASHFEAINKALHVVECANTFSLPSGKKGVRFCLDKNQIIPRTEHSLSPEDIESCWWTPEERETAKQSYQDEVRKCQNSEDESLETLLHTINQCNQCSSDHLTHQDNAVRCIAQSTIPRGLESDVATISRQLRRKHNRAVLEYTQKIPKQLRSDMKEQMLAARSLQFSRAHKILARIFGQVDSISCNEQ